MQARFRCRLPLPLGEGEGEGEKLILNWRLLFNLGDYAFDGSFRLANRPERGSMTRRRFAKTNAFETKGNL